MLEFDQNGLIKREAPAVQTYYLSGGTRTAWEHLVLNQAETLVKQTLESTSSEDRFPRVVSSHRHLSPAKATLARMYDIESQFYEEGYSRDSKARVTKVQFYSNLAADVKGRGRLNILNDLIEALSEGWEDLHPFVRAINRLSVSTIYLFVGGSERMLVGAKDGYHFQHINIPLTGNDQQTAPVHYLAARFIPPLALIGKRELVAVPTTPVHPDVLDKVRLPKPDNTPQEAIEQLLEDAYYRQRYVVPLEGAEIHFQNARDLQGLTLIESQGYILSNVRTTKGEAFVSIRLDDGSCVDPAYMLQTRGGITEAPKNLSEWSYVVALAYHDLVTAEEVSTSGYRPIAIPKSETLSREKATSNHRPSVIYIPRKVQVRSRPEFREPYQGLSRPLKPHDVVGYIRRGNITPEHQRELAIWELETGIKVPEIPEGHTFTRPYFVPKESGQRTKELPTFIRRKISEQLAGHESL